MPRRFQLETAGRDPRALNQYHYPSDGRIRRRLLEYTLDGMDYYAEAFRALRLSGDEAILNIGTGDGMDEVRLATEFGHRGPIVGIDLPSTKFDFYDNFTVARSILDGADITNVSYDAGNAMGLKYDDNSFDVVIWGHSAYHFVDVFQAISETKRVLKPKGKLLNLTNGDINKRGHHQIVAEIKSELGVNHHEPFSASFNLQTSRKVLQHLVGRQLVPVVQKSLYRINNSNLESLENSIDTYRSTVPQSMIGDFIPVRRQKINEHVAPLIDYAGGYLDYAYRGGGVYENSKNRTLFRLYLGRTALSLKKKNP